jgi:DIS3-like exonuclease 2
MLRKKRYLSGALALNQTKISFVLNKELDCMPYGYNVYQQKDSNRLVEEFMLLANIAVAHRIYNIFPTKAILRRHPSPNGKQLEQVGKTISSCGYNCDTMTSGSIQTYLSWIQETNPIGALTLTCLLTKTMQLAKYFCSGSNLKKEDYAHYGLAVPLYTHFTSPIRRYPDILVHRLLAASLDYCQESPRSASHLYLITENCNDKKYSARVCSERSSEMFFSLFIKVSWLLFKFVDLEFKFLE